MDFLNQLGVSGQVMADKYFCNFSLFQSLPDSWGIDQLFPIMLIDQIFEN
jgi:arginine decarboxylase